MKTLISLLAMTMFIIGTDGFIKCFNKMVGDVNKVKNTVGKKIARILIVLVFLKQNILVMITCL